LEFEEELGRDSIELVTDQVNELLLVIDTTATNSHFMRGKGFNLEFLKSLRSKVFNIVLVTQRRIDQSLITIGKSLQFVIELFVTT
jgi:hypothetical protein